MNKKCSFCNKKANLFFQKSEKGIEVICNKCLKELENQEEPKTEVEG